MFDFWLPMVAKADTGLAPLKQFIIKVEVKLLNPVIKLGFAVALLIFLYGIFEFIRNSESSEGRKTGANHILWGVIGMFIMLAAGGIMTVLCGTWGMDNPEACNPFRFTQ